MQTIRTLYVRHISSMYMLSKTTQHCLCMILRMHWKFFISNPLFLFMKFSLFVFHQQSTMLCIKYTMPRSESDRPLIYRPVYIHPSASWGVIETNIATKCLLANTIVRKLTDVFHTHYYTLVVLICFKRSSCGQLLFVFLLWTFDFEHC